MNREKVEKEQVILITDYDARWSKIYNREKAKILKAIGDKIVAIKHIGSTAVVNLAAKPVIDIMVAIKTLTDAAELITPLKPIGYEYVPEYEAHLPERRFFHRGPSETTGKPNRHFHLHMVEYSSQFWDDHLLFRDYLRNNKEDAAQYAQLKKEIACKCKGNVQDYCANKSDFIKNIVRLAHLKIKTS